MTDIQPPIESWKITNSSTIPITINDIPELPVIKSKQTIEALNYTTVNKLSNSPNFRNYLKNGTLSSSGYFHTHEHKDLDKLQGGKSNEYYHLSNSQHIRTIDFFENTGITAEEAEILTNGSDADSLHIHTELSIPSHNNLEGLNLENYQHLTELEKTDFITLTDGSDADDLHTHDEKLDTNHLTDFIHSDIALNTSKKHDELHTIASHSDTDATGSELDTLTDGSDADTLHIHTHTNLTDIIATEHTDHALNIDANLVAWLRMDDIDGSGNPEDLGTAETTWTKTGTAAQIDNGMIGKAFTFDGNSDYLSAGTPFSLPDGNDSRTVAFWVKRNGSTGNAQVLFNYGTAAATMRWQMQITTGYKLALAVSGSLRTGTSTDLVNGWHHVAMTFQGTEIEDVIAYIDGEVDNVFSISTPNQDIDTGTTFASIGATELSANYFFGDLDDFRIYNRALSADEIKELYELGTLDSMTNFDSAYYKEYVASRSGYFNNLNTTGDIRTGGTFVASTGAVGITQNINISEDGVGTHELTFVDGILVNYNID